MVVVLVRLIKLIVRVRHALMTYSQQSYDVSVHVYTYTKAATTITLQMRYETIAAMHSNNNHHITDDI